MNNPYQMYNNNVPMLRHTDWASVAKQWASLRADVNIPQRMNEQHNYIPNIPPPPPPSPPQQYNMSYSSDQYDSYQHLTPAIMANINHSNNQNNFQTPAFSVYEDKQSMAVKSRCETFDYNHGNRAYEYYNDYKPIESYTPPLAPAITSTLDPTYTQNMWSLPPPDHPDIVQPNFVPEVYTAPEPLPPPKLFPIANSDDFCTNNALDNHLPIFYPNKQPLLPKPVDCNNGFEKFDAGFVAAKPTKGLPAWIIDDMKKMKDKERKTTYHSIDTYKDNPTLSRRDSEGDVVMEDVHRPFVDTSSINNSEPAIIISGKNVTKHPQHDDIAITAVGIIDDVSSPHDDDEIVPKIDYASKTFSELVEMLDENEYEAWKIMVIRDSLTDVMKEITDDMIFAAVKSTFSRELGRGKKSHKLKGGSDSLDPTSKAKQTEAIGQLLGLAVYESDGDGSGAENQKASKTHDADSSRSSKADKKRLHKKSSKRRSRSKEDSHRHSSSKKRSKHHRDRSRS